MSIKLKLTAICDDCGVIIGEKEDCGTQEGYARARLLMEHAWKRSGKMEMIRNYRHTLHYCEKCADGGQVKITSKEPSRE